MIIINAYLLSCKFQKIALVYIWVEFLFFNFKEDLNDTYSTMKNLLNLNSDLLLVYFNVMILSNLNKLLQLYSYIGTCENNNNNNSIMPDKNTPCMMNSEEVEFFNRSSSPSLNNSAKQERSSLLNILDYDADAELSLHGNNHSIFDF